MRRAPFNALLSLMLVACGSGGFSPSTPESTVPTTIPPVRPCESGQLLKQKDYLFENYEPYKGVIYVTFDRDIQLLRKWFGINDLGVQINRTILDPSHSLLVNLDESTQPHDKTLQLNEWEKADEIPGFSDTEIIMTSPLGDKTVKQSSGKTEPRIDLCATMGPSGNTEFYSRPSKENK